MKTLFLMLIFTAQQLVSTDGTTWKRVAIGNPNTEKKFNLYVQVPLSGSKAYPLVRAKKDDEPIRTVKVDCKAGEFKYDVPGAQWTKAPKGTVAAALLKYVCK